MATRNDNDGLNGAKEKHQYRTTDNTSSSSSHSSNDRKSSSRCQRRDEKHFPSTRVAKTTRKHDHGNNVENDEEHIDHEDRHHLRRKESDRKISGRDRNDRDKYGRIRKSDRHKSSLSSRHGRFSRHEEKQEGRTGKDKRSRRKKSHQRRKDYASDRFSDESDEQSLYSADVSQDSSSLAERDRSRKQRHKKGKATKSSRHYDATNRSKKRTTYTNKCPDESDDHYSDHNNQGLNGKGNHRKTHQKNKKKRHRRMSICSSDSDSYHNDNSSVSLMKQKQSACRLSFAHTLFELLSNHPGFATELPCMLIRIAGGTSFDLRQMPNQLMAESLHQVFDSLSVFGVQKEANTGLWTWQEGGGSASVTRTARKKGSELVLIKVVRMFLDELGVSVQDVNAFEAREKNSSIVPPNLPLSLSASNAPNVTQNRLDVDKVRFNEIRELTLLLLQKFENRKVDNNTQENVDIDDNSAPMASLSTELMGICSMIMEGECIGLDGITDANLGETLKKLFVAIGLVKEALANDYIDEELDVVDCTVDNDKEVAFGYGLPSDEKSANLAKENILAVLDACRHQQKESTSDFSNFLGNAKRVLGPSMGPLEAAAHRLSTTSACCEDDDDAIIGPGPAGSALAETRDSKKPAMTPEMLKAMTDRRNHDLLRAKSNDPAQLGPALQGSAREEWMLIPGEHDFLKGITTGGGMKNRTFKNEKNSQQPQELSLSPKVQAEIDAILQAHADARGPSLIEQHRLKKAEEKAAAAASGKVEWKWNREFNLEDGRRVDKDALHSVLGGAKEELKNKFQGGLSKSFM